MIWEPREAIAEGLQTRRRRRALAFDAANRWPSVHQDYAAGVVEDVYMLAVPVVT
jgi:hypothetical protein